MSSVSVSEFLPGDLNQFFEGQAVSYKDPFKSCIEKAIKLDSIPKKGEGIKAPALHYENIGGVFDASRNLLIEFYDAVKDGTNVLVAKEGAGGGVVGVYSGGSVKVLFKKLFPGGE